MLYVTLLAALALARPDRIRFSPADTWHFGDITPEEAAVRGIDCHFGGPDGGKWACWLDGAPHYALSTYAVSCDGDACGLVYSLRRYTDICVDGICRVDSTTLPAAFGGEARACDPAVEPCGGPAVEAPDGAPPACNPMHTQCVADRPVLPRPYQLTFGPADGTALGCIQPAFAGVREIRCYAGEAEDGPFWACDLDAAPGFVLAEHNVSCDGACSIRYRLRHANMTADLVWDACAAAAGEPGPMPAWFALLHEDGEHLVAYCDAGAEDHAWVVATQRYISGHVRNPLFLAVAGLFAVIGLHAVFSFGADVIGVYVGLASLVAAFVDLLAQQLPPRLRQPAGRVRTVAFFCILAVTVFYAFAAAGYLARTLVVTTTAISHPFGASVCTAARLGHELWNCVAFLAHRASNLLRMAANILAALEAPMGFDGVP